MLATANRMQLDREVTAWVRRALAHARVSALPVDSEIAMQAALLEREGFAKDPADRIIYATARSAGVPLVTADTEIRDFDPARVVW